MRRLQQLSVVLLAAGSGVRFGGRKQLAPVGPDGAAIMDVLVRRAAAAGFDRAVIVIGPGMGDDVRTHLAGMVDPGVPIVLATQELRPGHTRPLGTADAVLAARDAVDGEFVVVNGDDLYPTAGFALLRDRLVNGPDDEHALVAFRVARTLAGSRPVMRARIDVDAESRLVGIREGAVISGDDGLRFEVDDEVLPLPDDALVSMNMWGFRPSVFDALGAAVEQFIAAPHDGEVYLPDAVAAQMVAGTAVRVLVTEESCLGITHLEDLAAVRRSLQ